VVKRIGIFINAFLPDAVIIFCLLYAGWKFMSPLENHIDIGLWDESGYLYQGTQLLKTGLPKAMDAPLYVVWYFLLSLFRPDRIGLYYFNYRLLAVLLPVAFYLVLRVNKKSLLVSVALAFFFLISFANLDVWPRVNHFALLVVLASFVVAGFFKDFLAQMAVFSLGGLMGSYVRPELFVVYILLSLGYLGILIVLVLKKIRSIGRNWIVLAGWAVISLLCLIFLGVPASGTDRLMVAFAQHFSLHWVEWNHLSLNGWTDYPQIMAQVFGSIQSPWQALVGHPGLFMKHILANAAQMVPVFWNLFFDHTPVILLPWRRNQENILLFIVAIGFLIYSLLPTQTIFKGRNGLPWKEFGKMLTKRLGEVWKTNAVQNAAPLVATAGYLLSAPLSILVIWPEVHYLLLNGLIYILMLALLAVHRAGTISIKYALIFGLVLMAVTPPFISNKSSGPLNNNTIQFLNTLKITGNVVMLEADGGYEYYVTAYPVQRIRHDAKSGNFNEFLSQSGINMVVVSPVLLNEYRYANDEEWINFLENYPAFGFERQDIPGSDRWVLISSALLAP